MRYFVILIEYITELENILKVTEDHRNHLKKGYEEGLFLISGPQVPRSGGVVIARCSTREELEEFFSRDPYFLNSFADYRFIEFHPKSYKPEIKGWAE